MHWGGLAWHPAAVQTSSLMGRSPRGLPGSYSLPDVALPPHVTVHCLTPADNVLLSGSGLVKIADFGQVGRDAATASSSAVCRCAALATPWHVAHEGLARQGSGGEGTTACA